MCTSCGHRSRTGAIAFVLLLAGTALALGYSQYSTDHGGDNCAACHGDFRASPYTEKGIGGQTWAADLMTTHLTMVTSCYTCHGDGPHFPVSTGYSAGGTGLSPYSCAGCHGRAADGTGFGSQGYGAALRQHHYRADSLHPTMNLMVCNNCHLDANPANKSVVGEDSLPTYYAEENASNHVNNPNLPADPCNLTAPFEDIDGTPDGLDNDGDLVYDSSDSDCSLASPSPGESSSIALAPLRVTSVNPAAGTLTISYEGGCLASDNTLVFGDLSQVSTYGYSDQVCNIGNTGTFGWSYPAGSAFFLVVGNDGAHEGSYGLSTLMERPPFATATTCPLPQDPANRCD